MFAIVQIQTATQLADPYVTLFNLGTTTTHVARSNTSITERAVPGGGWNYTTIRAITADVQDLWDDGGAAIAGHTFEPYYLADADDLAALVNPNAASGGGGAGCDTIVLYHSPTQLTAPQVELRTQVGDVVTNAMSGSGVVELAAPDGGYQYIAIRNISGDVVDYWSDGGTIPTGYNRSIYRLADCQAITPIINVIGGGGSTYMLRGGLVGSTLTGH